MIGVIHFFVGEVLNHERLQDCADGAKRLERSFMKYPWPNVIVQVVAEAFHEAVQLRFARKEELLEEVKLVGAYLLEVAAASASLRVSLCRLTDDAGSPGRRAPISQVPYD